MTSVSMLSYFSQIVGIILVYCYCVAWDEYLYSVLEEVEVRVTIYGSVCVV